MHYQEVILISKILLIFVGKLGLLAGKLKVPEDIMDDDLELNEMFYGKDTEKQQ